MQLHFLSYALPFIPFSVWNQTDLDRDVIDYVNDFDVGKSMSDGREKEGNRKVKEKIREEIERIKRE